jgi:hypothetical protein
MRITKYLCSAFLVLLFCSLSASVVVERFWICFLTGFSEKYITQIDSLGNILLPPVKVEKFTIRTGGVTALSFNDIKALNLWFISSRNGRIYRAAIDKKTLKTVRFVQTALRGVPVGLPILDVTKRDKNNFISFAVQTTDGVRIAAYPINEFGQVIGKRWFLSPPRSSSCEGGLRCRGGMAANGHLTYWTEINQTKERQTDLFIRPLGALGRPIKDPVFVDSILSRFARGDSFFKAADATGILPGNKRFLVYIKADPPVDVPKPERLLLQRIDATTGKKIGQATILYRDEQIFGNVKIDPFGRFVLITGSFGQSGPRLGYLALDSNGKRSGNPKVLSNLAVGGIDLLRENL